MPSHKKKKKNRQGRAAATEPLRAGTRQPYQILGGAHPVALDRGPDRSHHSSAHPGGSKGHSRQRALAPQLPHRMQVGGAEAEPEAGQAKVLRRQPPTCGRGVVVARQKHGRRSRGRGAAGDGCIHLTQPRRGRRHSRAQDKGVGERFQLVLASRVRTAGFGRAQDPDAAKEAADIQPAMQDAEQRAVLLPGQVSSSVNSSAQL